MTKAAQPTPLEAARAAAQAAGELTPASLNAPLAVSPIDDRFRMIVSAIQDYAIFMLDVGGHVLTWNAGAQRLKGYAAEEILGKHFSVFYPEADRQSGKAVTELEVATRAGRFEEEGWRVRKDGTRFWANVVLTPLLDDRGALVGFAKVTRDLTARREAEEELRQSEQRLRLLVESVKDYAIFMLDPQGRVQTWNTGAQRIKGYTAAEIIGRPIDTFYTPEDRAANKAERLLRIAAQEGRIEDEGWRVRKDGTHFWADVVLSAVRGPDGELVGFSKVTRDLTDRRASEHARIQLVQAKESLRLRDEFLSIASHELRTPLTALNLQIATLRDSSSDADPKTAARLERAARITSRLSDLVETLLDVSRVATDKLSLQIAPANLGELVSDAVDRLSHSADAAHCKVTVSGDTDIRGEWDRLRIEQVLTNLLSNAFRYAAGTPVEIALARQGEQVEVTIRDGGPGIDPSALDRIFDRFERAASSRHYGGLGLGLYVSRQIAQAHGGTLTAENLPGRGARFRLTLPRIALAQIPKRTEQSSHEK